MKNGNIGYDSKGILRDNLLPYVALIILILAHLMCWMLAGTRKIQHSPVKITTLLSGIHTIPHYIICVIDPEKSILYASLGSDYITYFVQFGVLYSIALIVQTIFLMKVIKIKMPSAARLRLKDDYPYDKVVLILLGSYIAIVAVYFSSIGGLLNYLSNFYQRVALREGMEIFDMFRPPLAYLTLMFLVASYKSKPNSSLKVFFLILFFMVLLEAFFGGRRNPIQFLIFGYLGLLTVDSGKRLISTSSVIVATLVVTVFVGLYYFRSLASLQAGSSAVITSEIPALTYLLNLSYNDIYIFVMSHFSNHDFWYGSIYGDIFNKFASYLFGYDAPSPDEGVYIYNLYQGMSVKPPMLLDQMLHNSWPPRTFGNGYLNFGIAGVLILFSIKGALIGLMYKAMKTSENNPFFMYIYFYMVFSFQISNLKIFEFITILLVLAIILITLSLITSWKFTFRGRRL